MVDIMMFFVLGAWLFWGTYPVPFKHHSVVKEDIDPFVFQCMKSSVVFLTSWLVLTWKEFVFTYYGFIGSALWIPSGLLFITSVKLTGVAFATPVANGTQVIVSFLWGAIYYKEPVHSLWLSILSMAIMILGMIGISVSVNYEKMQKAKQDALLSQGSINITTDAPDNERIALLQHSANKQEQPQTIENGPKKTPKDILNFWLGIGAALLCGFFGGTQNVPLKNAPPNARGIEYIISFGIGSVAVIFVWTVVYTFLRVFILKIGPPTAKLRKSFLPGMTAGLLWSVGNVCQIYVTLHFGETIGYPLVMCNMMVAGLWGVFYYNEAKSILLKGVFILSCLTLLGGVTLLTRYG